MVEIIKSIIDVIKDSPGTQRFFLLGLLAYLSTFFLALMFPEFATPIFILRIAGSLLMAGVAVLFAFKGTSNFVKSDRKLRKRGKVLLASLMSVVVLIVCMGILIIGPNYVPVHLASDLSVSSHQGTKYAPLLPSAETPTASSSTIEISTTVSVVDTPTTTMTVTLVTVNPIETASPTLTEPPTLTPAVLPMASVGIEFDDVDRYNVFDEPAECSECWAGTIKENTPVVVIGYSNENSDWYCVLDEQTGTIGFMHRNELRFNEGISVGGVDACKAP